MDDDSMATELLKASWADLDHGELMCILYEHIGEPGQYHDVPNNPNVFYLPLGGSSAQLRLTFSTEKRIRAIEPGPAVDATRWQRVGDEVETAAPVKLGRDWSFSGFRVLGSWRGVRSGVQILPPPPDAPRLPHEGGDHPFVLEFPVRASERWRITNYRRMRE